MPGFWHKLDRPALVVASPDEPLLLQIGQVFVDCSQGAELEMEGDFLERRRVLLFFDVRRQIIQDFPLSLCQRHGVTSRPKVIRRQYTPNTPRNTRATTGCDGHRRRGRSQRLLLGQTGTERTVEWGARVQHDGLVRPNRSRRVALRRDRRGYPNAGVRLKRMAGMPQRGCVHW